jgi:hypothetical protein
VDATASIAAATRFRIVELSLQTQETGRHPE